MCCDNDNDVGKMDGSDRGNCGSCGSCGNCGCCGGGRFNGRGKGGDVGTGSKLAGACVARNSEANARSGGDVSVRTRRRLVGLAATRKPIECLAVPELPVAVEVEMKSIVG